MTFKLVIFDCDGVLVDSEGLSNDLLAAMLAEYGHRISGHEARSSFRGVNLTKCLEIVARETGIDLPATFEADLRKRMSAAFRAQLQPVAGALRLVESLRVPFCVASSGPRPKIVENLQLTALYEHFADRIFSGYEIRSWKPDPGLFLAAARHFDIAPEDCVVIEDSFVGVSAGLAANMTVLALDTAVDTAGLATADKVFGSLDDIRGFLVSQGAAYA